MHIPVLKKEVLEIFQPKRNQNFIDATLGEGGHTFAILEKIAPKGKVLTIELTPELIEKVKRKAEKLALRERIIFVKGNFSEIKKIARNFKFEPDGILFDLGLSSWHLEEAGRGFSFKREEILDMRFDPSQNLKAVDILNSFSEEKLTEIFKNFSQERWAKKIAKEIINFRKKEKILTTKQLVEILRKAVPFWYQRRKRNFYQRIFQGLRIAVNKELENLKVALKGSLEILKKGGKLGVISFHSLEDRIVKNFFKEKEKEGKLKILTKKPISPSKKEILINKKARSAKLRVAQKI